MVTLLSILRLPSTMVTRVRRLSNRLGRRRNTIQTNITNHHPEISRIGLAPARRLHPAMASRSLAREPEASSSHRVHHSISAAAHLRATSFAIPNVPAGEKRS